jgi:hypothetical protein
MLYSEDRHLLLLYRSCSCVVFVLFVYLFLFYVLYPSDPPATLRESCYETAHYFIPPQYLAVTARKSNPLCRLQLIEDTKPKREEESF